MNDSNNLLQVCGTLNRVFAAFFMNDLYTRHGIAMNDAIPTMRQLVELNEEGHFFTENDSPYGLKHFFHGKMTVENIDLQKLRTIGIADFIKEDLQDKLNDLTNYFAQAVKSFEPCDFVFSSLPDAPPFAFDCILDPESNFRSRLIIGRDLANERYNAIFEFYCLLVSKFREVEAHTIYGKSYKDVAVMTPEEREKCYPQPIPENEHDRKH